MNSNYDDDPKVLLTNAQKFGENSHFVTNTQTHMNESASQQHELVNHQRNLQL